MNQFVKLLAGNVEWS